MAYLRFYIFAIALLITLFTISCDKNKGLDEAEIPLIPDSVLLMDLSNCDAQHTGQFAFEYQDQFYQFSNPSVTTYIDTIPGSSYFLSDTVTFYKKTVRINAPLNNNKELIIEIEEVENPMSDCLPLKEYFENNYAHYENGANFCILPNPDNIEMALPLCSSVTARISEIHEYGSSSTNLSQGSLEIISCDKGSISGFFESELVTKGRFCGIEI